MARLLVCCAVVVVPLSFGILAGSAGRAAAPDSIPEGTSTARAAKLVEQALDAGLAGDSALRTKLLAEAVAADGDYAPARWQSGQVNFNGRWQSPEQIGELVSSHPRWRQYKELRDSAAGVLADHVALARWCLKNELAAEERYHWMNVLLADPSHKQARRRLSMREYRGGLFTEKQIAEHERLEQEAAAKLKKYKPQFTQLVREARSESRSARDTALAKIRAISDLGAIAPLQEVIGRSRRDDSDPSTRDLNLSIVAALANMREHEAALTLLNYALFSESEEVRTLAAESLRPRPTTDYVPLLMGAMTAPIEAEFDVVAAPDGTVRMIETLYQSGSESDASHTHSTNFEVAGAFGRDRMKANPNVVLGNHLARARQHAEATQGRVESFNAAAEDRNARIQATLKIAAGMDFGSDPESYWTAWKENNEIYYYEEPTQQTYDEETYTYSYEQAPDYTILPGVVTAQEETRTCCCFALGTLVWTQAGPRAIEEIAVGDMVLAQHPTTGELAYRPVLQTTVGVPMAVVQIALPGERITATLGHRFWVNGRGWQMAKELTPAMGLHAIDRGLDVTAIEKGEDVACHNLVVDEFHTFFVGKSRILVHDKSCPAPTPAIIPGKP
jgi:hypothetical protein